MTLTELKKNISLFQYFEDDTVLDAAIASIIATRIQYGQNIWFIIIGPSSGGKSQILRPLAMTDEKFIHRIDDLTENTFMSGANIGKGNGEPSLLLRIGERGILVFSDLTMLFSKNTEAQTTILGQFRGIYDGEVTKHSGTLSKPLVWRGRLGVLAGSTPSIYRHFEEQADMGERFVYWRMRDFDPEKATRLAIKRTIYGRELDMKLAEFYTDYIKTVIKGIADTAIVLDTDSEERIIKVGMFAELIRTVAHTTWNGVIDKIPVPAYPMRTAEQLIAIAKGLLAMRKVEYGNDARLSSTDCDILEWCGISLANDEKRAVLKIICSQPFGIGIRTQTVADAIGLGTDVIGVVLQNLASVGILSRTGDSTGLLWSMKKEDHWTIVRRVERLVQDVAFTERVVSAEEQKEAEGVAERLFESL